MIKKRFTYEIISDDNYKIIDSKQKTTLPVKGNYHFIQTMIDKLNKQNLQIIELEDKNKN